MIASITVSSSSSPFGSLQAKDFIRELLVKETENRLGQRKVLQRLNDINSLKD
ncbi:unnamed protein product [Brassica rapa]|uniref:Uncharacterized protein n=1 Tax=Brassica campestris TaxID=3711 RepID=A0A8D9M4C8_BRACM|nr:unnamed protein product [Brassica rapa]